MPRAGLSSQDVVAAAAELADEAGFQELTMGEVASRLACALLRCTSTWQTRPTCGTASPPWP